MVVVGGGGRVVVPSGAVAARKFWAQVVSNDFLPLLPPQPMNLDLINQLITRLEHDLGRKCRARGVPQDFTEPGAFRSAIAIDVLATAHHAAGSKLSRGILGPLVPTHRPLSSSFLWVYI